MAAGYTGNGPRAGRSTGRQRNTLVNRASKAPGAVPPPVVSPGSAIGYGAGIAGLTSSLYQTLAQLTAQKGSILGQFKMDRAAARSQAIGAMSGAVGQALDTGTVGSSYDLETRTGVLAQREAAMQAARQARIQGLLGLRAERINAANDYFSGLYQIQQQRAAEQAQMANQAFLQDLVMRLNDETVTPARAPAAPAPSTVGAPGTAPATPPTNYPGLAERLQRLLREGL